MTNNTYIRWFKDLSLDNVPQVGGKNAALGEMVSGLVDRGINVPDGFAITAEAYNHFLDGSGVKQQIKDILSDLDTTDIANLQERGKQVRQAILEADLPEDLQAEITSAYKEMGQDMSVAVRSSATAEDLPGASFAGQQETYLNIVGGEEVLKATKKCIASLFTDRAISYREDKGFSHFDVALSVGVQQMVRTDLAASGVMFTIDTESGFDQVVIINSAYGLGEYVVQGKVTPDEFVVFKPALENASNPIISRTRGAKEVKLIYGDDEATKEVPVPEDEQAQLSLADEEVVTLAQWGVEVQEFFSQKYGQEQPMDIEWGKDGKSGELFILQARPETIHSVEGHIIEDYKLEESGEEITKGAAIGSKIASGKVRVIMDVEGIHDFQEGEILVTDITDPDWEPIMKIASAIVTDKGGRTSHAAIVSRELGIPAIVGTEDASKLLSTGDEITVDCATDSTGVVYRGKLDYNREVQEVDNLPEVKTKIMMNIGAPGQAFRHWRLPVKGVGLGRLEFIIASHIQVHPRALLEFDSLKNKAKHEELVSKIESLTKGFSDKSEYYTSKLSEGIALIAATFYPHPVIIRFSDFKTNEYKTLLGGELYEPDEENPMLGWRGSSRYYHPDFKPSFGLEVQAIKRVREDMELSNVIPMVPFCRTLEEGEKVIGVMKEFGLDREQDDSLKIYMMCEIPANITLAEEFLKIFDGYSIGSNDLTQLMLGLDRDSALIADVGNENNEAIKKVVSDIIKRVKSQGKYIGICGQAPSDYPDFARFLVEEDIDSMSLSSDTVISTIQAIAKIES